MGEAFNGHIDRASFEKKLRDSFCQLPADLSKNPVLACQGRALEVTVQFALFMADELNAGTQPDVLFDAGTRVIGGFVENLVRAFESDDPNENVLASALDRVRWAVSNDDDDVVVEVSRPQTLGGKA
jgi:hypothetical protein